jgi:hypothetical protein
VRIVEIAVTTSKKIACFNVKFGIFQKSPQMQSTITSFVSGMCNMPRFEPHDTFKIEKNRKNAHYNGELLTVPARWPRKKTEP